MTAPTDQAIASWKGRRTTAVQNVQAVITRVDTETLDENNPTLVDLEGLLTDLEVKFSTYEKAHDKIVGQATPDQLNREEYGNTISLEHEQLLGYLEDAEATVRNAIKTLKRRQDTLEKENVRQQRVQQAATIKDGRINTLKNTIATMRTSQQQAYQLLDSEADKTDLTFPELSAFHVGFTSARYRMSQLETKARELTELDPALYDEYETDLQARSLAMTEEFCRILNKLRPQVMANQHVEALLALYPELQPVAGPGTPQHQQESTPQQQPQPGATDWEKLASTLAKGIAESGLSGARSYNSVKKQDPPRFSGAISEYARWKKNWNAIIKENKLSEVVTMRYLVEAMPVKEVSLRSRLGNCKTLEESWKILTAEFGDPEDLLRDRLARLSSYQPPKWTKSLLVKFKDFMSVWREVRADLREVTLLHKMDHDLTFREFIQHMERDSTLRWVTYEAEQSAKNKLLTRGAIFDAWLDIELSVLKAMDYTDPHSEVGKKGKPGDKEKEKVDPKDSAALCFACGEPGHRRDACKKVDKNKKCNTCGIAGHIAKACRKGKRVKPAATNAGSGVSTGNQMQCPKCRTEHTWKNFKGEERTSTRYGNCPKFIDESVNDRAKSIEAAKGCVKCLDFTGLHKHGDCRFQGRCGVCQRNHNTMLHGTSSAYVDCCNKMVFDEVVEDEDSESGSGVDDSESPETANDHEHESAAESHENSSKKCSWQCKKGDRILNPVIQTKVDSDWRRRPPTHNEIYLATREANNTLFLAEEAAFYDVHDLRVLGNIFHDIGSNVSYISEPFAKKLGLAGTPKELRVMHTGNKIRIWKTAVYKVSVCGPTGLAHTIMCYGVPTVSGDLETPDWAFIEELFPGRGISQSLHRATGPIDVLLSATYLSLYPKEIDTNNNLRLYRSVLDPEKCIVAGCHHKINLLDGDKLSEEAQLNRNVHILPETALTTNAGSMLCDGGFLAEGLEAEPPNNKYEPDCCAGFDSAGVSLKEMDFWSGEEMPVATPKRCGRCRRCTRCKEEAQNVSRQDAEHLAIIRDNMRLELDESRPGHGKIYIKYPEIKSVEGLKDNAPQAKGFQAHIEKELDAKSMRELYNDQFYEYVENGVFKRLSAEEMAAYGGPVNYVVHHYVLKPSSVSTKLRIVSNSSMGNRNSGNVSPNQCWAKGPDMLRPIVECQCAFRGFYCVCAYDMKRAYNSVYTGERDGHLRRLVWRRSTQDPWEHFMINRMHFGDRPAACGLEEAKNMTADAGRHVCPETAETVKRGYVDDNAGGGRADFVDKMIGKETFHADGSITYDGTVQQILSYGGFTVKVMLRNGETRPEVIDKFGDSVLGMRWDPTRDVIIMKMPVNFSVRDRRSKVRMGPSLTLETIAEIDSVSIKKEELLSQIASTYDVMGFLSPLTLKIKLLMQEVVSMGIGWKEEVTGPLLERIREALKMMVTMGEVEFQRSFLGAGWEQGYELVAYFDGADPASAAVVYARTPLLRPNPGVTSHSAEQLKTHEVRFVMAKARVTPTGKKAGSKRKSTPRTELRGVLILSRLVSTILRGVTTLPTRIMMFGDSQTIIGTLGSTDKVLDVWYGNRVDAICEAIEEWQQRGVIVDEVEHWPTQSNIADLCTRGDATPADILPGTPWQDGPEQLQYDRTTWPTNRDFCRVKVDEFATHAGVIKQEREHKSRPSTYYEELVKAGAKTLVAFIDLVNRVITRKNDFEKIVRIVARLMSQRMDDPEFVATREQRELAEKAVFMAATAHTNPVHFKRFVPMRREGILVTEGGRLGQLPLMMLTGMKNLPLLAYTNPLAKVLMLEAHLIDHFRTDSTLEKSRRKAWISSGRKLAARVCEACMICRRRDEKRVEQAMGLVVKEAVLFGSLVFARVHADMFGPYWVKAMNNARSRLKVWVLLVACEVTGALHSEVLAGASTMHFMVEWEKFIATRGRPNWVVSDNGTNFKSKTNTADSANLTSVDWLEVERRELKHKTTWEFVTPGAQWRNSKAERRVKTLKKVLATVLATTLNPNRKLEFNYSEFQGIIKRVTNVANDRPVDLKVVRGEFAVPVTVNHLLLGRNRGEPGPEVKDISEHDGYRMQHLFVSEVEKLWWEEWRMKALSTLVPYHAAKDAQARPNLCVGDVVMEMKDSKVAAAYTLARIVKADPSERDGLVRTVSIAALPKNILKKSANYDSSQYKTRPVAVQNLVLIATAEEVNKKFWEYKEDGDSEYYEVEAALPLPEVSAKAREGESG